MEDHTSPGQRLTATQERKMSFPAAKERRGERSAEEDGAKEAAAHDTKLPKRPDRVK